MTKQIRILDLKKHAAQRKLQETHDTRRKAGLNVDDLTAQLVDAAAAAHPDRNLLEQAVAEANGKASAHTYNATQIEWLAETAEKRLARDGITVANRVGAVVTAISEVPTAKAYNRKSRSAIATRVVMRRTTACWIIEKIEKFERYTGPGGDEKIVTTISEAARDDIMRKALDGYAVAKPVALDAAA